MDGGKGSGPEIGPCAKLIQCDQQAIVSVKPWSRRVVGLLFIAFGLFMGDGNFPRNPDVSDPRPFVIPVVVLVFAGLGYLLLLPWTLRIEVATRTYNECWGGRRLRKVTKGGWEDFAHLSLRTYQGGGGTALQLHWRNPERKTYTLHLASREEAQHCGLAVASLLGLPLVDEEGKRVPPRSLPMESGQEAPVKAAAGVGAYHPHQVDTFQGTNVEDAMGNVLPGAVAH